MEPATFTGGLRVGESYWLAANYTWPLASLTIKPDGISLKAPLHNITLTREQIIGTQAYRGIISDGIQFRHASGDLPKFIVFWTFSDKVAEELKRAAIPYEDRSKEKAISNKSRSLSVIIPILVLPVIFLILLGNEYHMSRETPDAIINSAALTLFLAVVYFVVRSRVLR